MKSRSLKPLFWLAFLGAVAAFILGLAGGVILRRNILNRRLGGTP